MNKVSYSYTKTTCPKCGGSGTLHQYAHIANGECFHCNGTGEVNGELIQTVKTTADMMAELRSIGLNIMHIADDTDGEDWESIFDNSGTEAFEAGIAMVHSAF
jgi:DnaJ-class molecular chaperone